MLRNGVVMAIAESPHDPFMAYIMHLVIWLLGLGCLWLSGAACRIRMLGNGAVKYETTMWAN